MSYHTKGGSGSGSTGSTGGAGSSINYPDGGELYVPTNTHGKRRMGRMAQSYSLADPYGSLDVRPVISNGAVSGFDPISAVYCPSTEKVHCGSRGKFIYALNPKQTKVDKSDYITFVDSSSSAHAITANGDVQHSIAEQKIGASSIKFDGTGDYLTAPAHSDFNFASDDPFTIECWINLARIPTASTNRMIPISIGTDFMIHFNELDGNGRFYVAYNDTWTWYFAGLPGVDTWTHVAITRDDSGNTKVYYDGVQQGSTFTGTNIAFGSGVALDIGYESTSYGQYFEGYIDEIRVSDSVRYTAGFENDLPTSAFVSDANTKLLIHSEIRTNEVYRKAIEESIIWDGKGNFTRKDYVGNFTSYENKYYVDGVYSPCNKKIYYLYNSKDYFQTMNGGFGIAKLNPYTNKIEEEHALYNLDAADGKVYNDSNLSQIKNLLPLPKKLIYCPSNNKIYILHGDPIKSWVSVLDPTSTTAIKATLPNDSFKDASDIEYCPINDRIYVANAGGLAISVIDPHGVTTLANVAPFTPDGSTSLLLHLDYNFSDFAENPSAGATRIIGNGQLYKDHQIGTGPDEARHVINYKTYFSPNPDEEKLDKDTFISPTVDDRYSRRWKEKDLNKAQESLVHTIFDGENCQKIPYRPEWHSSNDEFTVEFWIKPDKDFFVKRNYDSSTGRYIVEKYEPDAAGCQPCQHSASTSPRDQSYPSGAQDSSMLLFSFGNLHGVNFTPGAFGLVLKQGRNYTDSSRGNLKVYFNNNAILYSANMAPDDDNDKIKFGEWNHIAIIKQPLNSLSGDFFRVDNKLIIYVNGIKWGEIDKYDTYPQWVSTKFEINETNSPYLYLGGNVGTKSLKGISKIDFEEEEITTIYPHGLSDGDEVNLYSRSGDYPSGVNQFTKYYIKKTSDNKLLLYLDKDDATSSALMPPIDLQNLKSEEFSVENLFLSQDTDADVAGDEWMHYSGLMNSFRFSNIVRYDKNFRPTRFRDFREDDETILLAPGGRTARVRNSILDLESVGVLETSYPAPGRISGVQERGLNLESAAKAIGNDNWTAPAWIEEIGFDEPSASFQLPFGYNAEDMITINDSLGKFHFKDDTSFSIEAEVNFIKPAKIDQSYIGIDKPISIAHYESDDGKVKYEFAVSKLAGSVAGLDTQGSGLYFRQWNEGVLIVELFGPIYSGTLGNNTWHTFKVERDKDNKYSIYHESSLLSSEVVTVQLYPVFSGKGKFKIGRGSWHKVLAIGGYKVLKNDELNRDTNWGWDSKPLLLLDPNIGNLKGNLLGSSHRARSEEQPFSSTQQIGRPEINTFVEMENIEIVSLGGPKDASGMQLDADLMAWKPIRQNGDVDTFWRENSRLHKLHKYDALNHGAAFFKGDFTPAGDSASDWRKKSDGSYIKKLNRITAASNRLTFLKPDNTASFMEQYPESVPVYGFWDGGAAGNSNNFSIECTIMPLDLSSMSNDSNVDAEMGILCFNYDKLQDSDVNWGSCPEYEIHDGTGASVTWNQCLDDSVADKQGKGTFLHMAMNQWLSSSSNTGTVGWELKINSSGKAVFNFGTQARNTVPSDLNYFYNGTPRSLVSSTTLSHQSWYTITISRIGENVYLYINGTKEATVNVEKEVLLEHPIYFGLSKYEKMGLLIGKSYDGVTKNSSTPYYFTGLMNEVRVRFGRMNAHHTSIPDQSFSEDKVRRTTADRSLQNQPESWRWNLADGANNPNFTVGSADFLYLNFNNFLRNKVNPGYEQCTMTVSGLDETIDIEEEGILEVRENLEEGVVYLGNDDVDNGYLTVAGSSRLNLGSTYTVEGWFKENDDSPTGHRIRLLQQVGSNGTGWQLIYNVNRSQLEFFINFSGGSGNFANSSTGRGEGGLTKSRTSGAGFNGVDLALEWKHFVMQRENDAFSLFLNGVLVSYIVLDEVNIAIVDSSSNERITVGGGLDYGSNAGTPETESVAGYYDNIRITKSATYKNYRKDVAQHGTMELLREPNVNHFEGPGGLDLYYGKLDRNDHSLKLKSDYANGKFAYLFTQDNVDDFNFGSEDFTIELSFRCDTLSDLPLGASVLIGKGTPSSHTFYIGLETDGTQGHRRARLVAEAGGVKLEAKENDPRWDGITNEPRGGGAFGDGPNGHHDGPPPPALYFYDIKDFYDNNIPTGHEHVGDDYIVQKYKHVMLCRHTYAGVPYLSLFVDKRLVASNYEISGSVAAAYPGHRLHTYTTTTLNDLTDTSYNLTIGTSSGANGVIGTFFSGNISLVRIERGTNPALSSSENHYWLSERLRASSAADLSWTYWAGESGGSSYYGGINWATGNIWDYNQYGQPLGKRLFNRTLPGRNSDVALTGGDIYPEIDSWYFQPALNYTNSLNTTLPITGGTELFIDFREGLKDLSPKNRSIITSSNATGSDAHADIKDDTASGDSAGGKVAYTPPTNASAAYFGEVSKTTLHKDHVGSDIASAGDEVIDFEISGTGGFDPDAISKRDYLAAYDYKNKWDYFNNQFTISVWVKPEDLSVSPVIFSRGVFEGSEFASDYIVTRHTSFSITSSGQPRFYHKDHEDLDQADASWFMPPWGNVTGYNNTLIVEPEWSDEIKEDEWSHIALSKIDSPSKRSDLEGTKSANLAQKDKWYDLDIYFGLPDAVFEASQYDTISFQLSAKPPPGMFNQAFLQLNNQSEILTIEATLEYPNGTTSVQTATVSGPKSVMSVNLFDLWTTPFSGIHRIRNVRAKHNGKWDPWGYGDRYFISRVALNATAPSFSPAIEFFIPNYTWYWYINGSRYNAKFQAGSKNDVIKGVGEEGRQTTQAYFGDHESGRLNIGRHSGNTAENLFSGWDGYPQRGPESAHHQYIGYMAELLIATEPHPPSSLQYASVYKGGAKVFHPDSIKFLLNFDDLEDHSTDIERGRPETSESTVLLLPFDDGLDDKSGQGRDIELRTLEHLFWAPSALGDWWINEKNNDGTIQHSTPAGEERTLGFWDISGDANDELAPVDYDPSVTGPILNLSDRIVGTGSAYYNGDSFSVLDDSEDWDFGREDFTIEFWYKKSDSGVSSNVGPFAANGTCIVARQGYGFAAESLGWGVELSYIKQDLGTLFHYWRQKESRGVEYHVDGGATTSSSQPDVGYKADWEDNLTTLDSPEMRFYFSVDNGKIDSGGSATSGMWMTFTLSLGTPRDDRWEHYAVTRKDGVFRTFKNGKIVSLMVSGTSSGSGSVDVLAYDKDPGGAWRFYGEAYTGTLGYNIKSPSNNAVLAVGGDTRFIGDKWYLEGYIDELRISKTARYTSDFDIGIRDLENGAVEDTITTTQKTAAITYCPADKNLYAFTSKTGEAYRIDPTTNQITQTSSFSTSTTEEVKNSYFCPINNTILISSYDGAHKLYSFLPRTGEITKTFNVVGEGRMTYAPTTNEMYYACKNYVYEIGD